MFYTNKQYIGSVQWSQFSAIPCSKHNFFVGETVRQISLFLSHSSFSKRQHLRKTVVAGILSTDRRQQTNFSHAESFWKYIIFTILHTSIVSRSISKKYPPMVTLHAVTGHCTNSSLVLPVHSISTQSKWKQTRFTLKNQISKTK